MGGAQESPASTSRPDTEKQPQAANERNQIEPVICDDCGRITAQPRRLAFWRVTSFVLGSHKSPVQKIYCNGCAKREQWKSTLWTALLGWWGVPWGPFWSAGYGVKNAVGGSRHQPDDEALLWQSALAFASSGEGAIAVGLANHLRKSENDKLAHGASELIRVLAEQGIDPAVRLKNAWEPSIMRTAAMLVMTFAAPGAVAAAIAFSQSGTPYYSGTTAGSSYPVATLSNPVSEQAAAIPETITVEAPEQAPPSCAVPPRNGAILSDIRSPVDQGHKLTIENGTRGDAVVKVRDAASGRTLVSYFVKEGESASLTGIPDGTYRFQYAFGTLGADCKSLGTVEAASEFPDVETLETKYETMLDGTSIERGHLTYTLYSTPGGNVHPDSISPDQFND